MIDIRREFLYEKVKEYIMNIVMTEKPHFKIPSRNKMQEELDVTRVTIDRAISELIGEGFLYAVNGSGTFVAERNEEEKADSSKIMSWGIIMKDIFSDVFPEILKGIEDVANQNNINVIVCNAENNIEKQEKYIKKLINSTVKGLIIMPPTTEEDTRLNGYKLLQKHKIPFVFCVRGVEGVDVPKIISDNHYGEYSAAKYLIKKGRKRIAFISVRPYSTSEQRLQGYMSALYEAGIGIDEELVFMSDDHNDEKAGRSGGEYLLKLKKMPDAAVCSNDAVACALFNTLSDSGIRIPADFSIIGYDDSEICNLMPVKISSVRYPKYESGVKAAQTLLELMKGNEATAGIKKVTTLMPELVVRESS